VRETEGEREKKMCVQEYMRGKEIERNERKRERERGKWEEKR